MNSKPIISLVASANRIEWWLRFYGSLAGNKTPWEVIFVGNIKPNFELPPNFKHIYATCKPAQCYQIGFWAAQGELIHWTADDADYNPKDFNCPNQLDIAYNKWLEVEAANGNDNKTVIALNPCEDGGFPQAKFHRLFGGWEETPVMAPFALVHRKYLSEPGTGYDNRFVSGQSENDIVMRVLEDGGRVEMCLDAILYVHHKQVHRRDPNTGREKNDFRAWYNVDREILENCWIKGGYGYYEKLNAYRNNTPETRKEVVAQISKTRLLPLQPFVQTEDVLTVSQGIKGQWA